MCIRASFKIIKNLSVGANFSYLWGDITRTAAETFPSSSSVFPITIQSNVAVKRYKLDFGAQYTHPVSYTHLDVYKRQVLIPVRISTVLLAVNGWRVSART